MPKKRRNSRHETINELTTALSHNGQAIQEGPKRKTWSTHDLKTIKPLTPAQEDMFELWFDDYNICAHGTAGTGKTFLAVYLALNEVLAKRQRRIIILRSAVPTREVGFVPGTLEEKLCAYEHPYHKTFWELLGKSSSYQDMKDAGLVDFQSTSFLRGLTWDNTIVIVEEGENLTFHEINTIMTRMGNNTRVIFTGDVSQSDLEHNRHYDKQGMSKAVEIFNSMKEFECVEFTPHDIVRGPLVRSWIEATEQFAA